MELNETAYQMLLSPDWNNVETAMLLLMSQPDTEQRAYLSRLLSECTMICYEELCESDEKCAYIKHEGWSCSMTEDDDGDITVIITHSINYSIEFKFFIFKGENIELLLSESIPSSLRLTIAIYNKDESHTADIRIYYEYLQDNWMNLFTAPKTFITLP